MEERTQQVVHIRKSLCNPEGRFSYFLTIAHLEQNATTDAMKEGAGTLDLMMSFYKSGYKLEGQP